MAQLPNPFRPAEKVEPKIKALVFGGPGIGKTYFALSSPGKVAVIDTEGGTAFYAGRKGLSAFDVLPTKSFSDVKRAVEFLAAGGHGYETLVIDPVTIIYETLQGSALLRRVEINKRRHRGATEVDEADLEQLDWGRIKRNYKQLMTALVNLPLHVIVTAREKEETRRNPQTGDFEQTGRMKPDAEKGTAYYFDIVLHLAPRGEDGRQAVVTKDRTDSHPLGAILPDPTFGSLFDKVLKRKGSAQRAVPDDAEAAARDAASEEQAERPTASAIGTMLEWFEAAGKDPAEVLAQMQLESWEDASALQVARLTEKARAAVEGEPATKAKKNGKASAAEAEAAQPVAVEA